MKMTESSPRNAGTLQFFLGWVLTQQNCLHAPQILEQQTRETKTSRDETQDISYKPQSSLFTQELSRARPQGTLTCPTAGPAPHSLTPLPVVQGDSF